MFSARRLVAMLSETRLGGVSLVLALLGLWETSARFEFVQSVNWPPFSAVLVALVRGLAAGDLGNVIEAILLAAVAYVLNQLFILWEARAIHWARTREAAWSEP